MHQALRTFDIVDVIFSFLRSHHLDGQRNQLYPWHYNIGSPAEDQESQECRKALFRSALCCKDFSSLALKHLWWNQESLQNILRLLPGYTFYQKTNTIAIDGFLDEQDWERADMYAKLIRSFTCKGTGGPTIVKETYYQIQATHKSRTLLPNLMEIYCENLWEEVYLLLSPSLRRVVLSDPRLEASSSASYFVNALPKICPDIQSLDVSISLSTSAIRSIRKLRQLQYLGLNFSAPESSNDECITGLSRLPNLRSLRFLSFLRGSSWKSQSPSNFPKSFCALRRLDFSAPLDVIANALPSFIFPNLTTFTVAVEASIFPTADENEYDRILREQLWYDVCDVLMKHARSPSTSLRQLSFFGWSVSISRLPTRAEAFQPLLGLHGLETLIFSVPLQDFNDETLGKWASAWPNLKTFDLAFDKYVVTLSGIINLLQLCRHLEKLTLGFDASGSHMIPEIPPTPPLCHCLKDWDIAESKVIPHTLDPVIAILSWAFRDLEDIKSRSDFVHDLPGEVLPHTLERESKECEKV